MQPASSLAPITVDIIVYPGFKAMEAIGPMSVFEYANLHRHRRGQPPGCDVRVASFKIGPVQSDTLMALDAIKIINTLALEVATEMVVYLKRPGGQSQFGTHLLAEVALPLKTVAARACFTDEAHMRRVFLKKLGIAPKVYRERFATTGITGHLLETT